MPEVLKFKNEPGVLSEFHIEPFHEEYIPGARVLCREENGGYKVFFQIPTPVAQKLNDTQMSDLKKQIHDWWQVKET
jgi:hypothetical protein